MEKLEPAQGSSTGAQVTQTGPQVHFIIIAIQGFHDPPGTLNCMASTGGHLYFDRFGGGGGAA